eukprot:TRINITY_DN2987_c3_g2_i1.p3 TRINITY_DN2987_c3_g2~~TRINITY_DN2987_c3_g2_i1.p3  ORF type:complete len:181 (+),score=41.08 TRINITY_DN2987_c3_g2_i1:61-603(+)
MGDEAAAAAPAPAPAEEAAPKKPKAPAGPLWPKKEPPAAAVWMRPMMEELPRRRRVGTTGESQLRVSALGLQPSPRRGSGTVLAAHGENWIAASVSGAAPGYAARGMHRRQVAASRGAPSGGADGRRGGKRLTGADSAAFSVTGQRHLDAAHVVGGREPRVRRAVTPGLRRIPQQPTSLW